MLNFQSATYKNRISMMNQNIKAKDFNFIKNSFFSENWNWIHNENISMTEISEFYSGVYAVSDRMVYFDFKHFNRKVCANQPYNE